jgi:thioredoxin reductase (NADPH)
MSETGTPIRQQALQLSGVRGCAEAYAIRDFLQRSDIPFEWTELSGGSHLPVCVFPDGTRMEHPTIRQISEKLGWLKNASLAEYDLVIFGAGPAGLSAAVYGASEGLRTVVIERSAIGGQAGTSSKIENYLGFPEGITGADMAQRAHEQASKFGAEILLLREGVRTEFLPGKGIGYLNDGTKVVMLAAICCTGVEYRRLNIPNEERFRGVGVFYGAGASEASMCVDEHVIVVGGGNSAGQAALHFARYASKVSIVVRGSGLKETLSNYLIDRIQASPRIEVLTRTEVTALDGDHLLCTVTLTHQETGRRQTIETSWLFLCLGGSPNTSWAEGAGIVRDDEGYLVTGPDLRTGGRYPERWPLTREPYYLETSKPGLFAAGDVRHGSVKRCAAAVGEGAMAVTFVQRYLALK